MRKITYKYRQWQKVVFERDNRTCQICGLTKEIMHADHIKRYSEFPELRYELSNGRTLCEECHIKTENYGNPVKHNHFQIIEFWKQGELGYGKIALQIGCSKALVQKVVRDYITQQQKDPS